MPRVPWSAGQGAHSDPWSPPQPQASAFVPTQLWGTRSRPWVGGRRELTWDLRVCAGHLEKVPRALTTSAKSAENTRQLVPHPHSVSLTVSLKGGSVGL